MSYDIVVPVYNALDFVQRFLGMLDTHYPERSLILVNDCSDAPTLSFLESYTGSHVKTELLKRQKRGWFTRASNTGLRYVLSKDGCRPEWVFMVNSDCTLNAGGFEEMLEVWSLAEKEQGKPVGLVGADGPKPHCPRYASVREPVYPTGHCYLFSTKLMSEQNLLFPWKDGQVRNYSADMLVHINSDRALSYEFNRRGFQTVVSYWAQIGHEGGKSWGHRLGTIPRACQVSDD